MVFRSIVIELRFLEERIVTNKSLEILFLFVNYLRKKLVQFSNFEFIIYNGIYINQL